MSVLHPMIKAVLIFALGLVVALLVVLIDMKAANLLGTIEGNGMNDSPLKKVVGINTIHNIAIAFVGGFDFYLSMRIVSSDGDRWKYGICEHAFLTAAIMILTTIITYFYFKLRRSGNKK